MVKKVEESQHTDALTKSVSALSGYCDNENENDNKPKDISAKGVSIENFDSLIEHMTSLNVKFFK